MKNNFILTLFLVLSTQSIIASQQKAVPESLQKKQALSQKTFKKSIFEKAQPLHTSVINKQPYMKIPEFAQQHVTAFLKPIAQLEKEILTMGTAYDIKNWPAKFSQLKHRLALLQPYMATHFKKDETYNNLFVLENEEFILTLLGIKPITSYINSFITHYQEFMPYLALFEGDKDLTIAPWKQEGETICIPPQAKPFMMARDPLIPLSKIAQTYPTAQLSKKYAEVIKSWEKVPLDKRLKILEEWMLFAHKLELDQEKIMKESPTVYLSFKDAGSTEDEAALMFGYQPLAYEKDELKSENDPFSWDFDNYSKNYSYRVIGGNTDKKDDSPYMKLHSGLTQYIMRKGVGDDAYLLMLAQNLLSGISYQYEVLLKLRADSTFNSLSAAEKMAYKNLENFLQEMFEAKKISLDQIKSPSMHDYALFIKNFLKRAK